MDDFSAFTAAERAVLEALNRRGDRFMVVGLSAAVLQGANTATRDIDLWFEIGGDTVGDRLDVVTHMHGLGTFAEELANTKEVVVDGVPLRVLSLQRIVASKVATGRKKDLAVIPALEEALAATEFSGKDPF
jgi:predicted nucleotidyltransferase